MKISAICPAVVDGHDAWLIELDDRFLGVNSQFGWCVRFKERVVFLDSIEKFIALEPLLELDYRVFVSMLDDAKKEAPYWALTDFPVNLLLKNVFHTSFSSYWPERAVDWLADNPLMWPELESELREFSENKVMSQSYRGRVKKMLRKFN